MVIDQIELAVLCLGPGRGKTVLDLRPARLPDRGVGVAESAVWLQVVAWAWPLLHFDLESLFGGQEGRTQRGPAVVELGLEAVGAGVWKIVRLGPPVAPLLELPHLLPPLLRRGQVLLALLLKVSPAESRFRPALGSENEGH
jgi:hypothetical protein